MMWFKALLLPLLGCIAVAVFLLSEFFFCSPLEDSIVEKELQMAKTERRGAGSRSPSPTNREGKTLQYSKSGRGNANGDSSSRSTSPTGDSVIRITLVNEHGSGNRYKVAPDTTMAEVIQYYCQRQDYSPDSIVLRYNGAVLGLDETPSSLGLENLSVVSTYPCLFACLCSICYLVFIPLPPIFLRFIYIYVCLVISHRSPSVLFLLHTETDHLDICPSTDVAVDYKKLFDELKEDKTSHNMQLVRQLEKERKQRHEADVKVIRIEGEVELLRKELERMTTDLTSCQKEYAKLEATTSKLERDTQTHREARKVAEHALKELEKDVAADRDHKEKKKLEARLNRTKAELEESREMVESLQQELQELRKSAQDASKLKKTKERLLESKGELGKKLETLTARVEQLEEEKVKAEEQARRAQQEMVTWMMRSEKLTEQLEAGSFMAVDGEHDASAGSDSDGFGSLSPSLTKKQKPKSKGKKRGKQGTDAANDKSGSSSDTPAELKTVKDENKRLHDKQQILEISVMDLKRSIATEKEKNNELQLWKQRAIAFESEVKLLQQFRTQVVAGLTFNPMMMQLQQQQQQLQQMVHQQPLQGNMIPQQQQQQQQQQQHLGNQMGQHPPLQHPSLGSLAIPNNGMGGVGMGNLNSIPPLNHSNGYSSLHPSMSQGMPPATGSYTTPPPSSSGSAAPEELPTFLSFLDDDSFTGA